MLKNRLEIHNFFDFFCVVRSMAIDCKIQTHAKLGREAEVKGNNGMPYCWYQRSKETRFSADTQNSKKIPIATVKYKSMTISIIDCF